MIIHSQKAQLYLDIQNFLFPDIPVCEFRFISEPYHPVLEKNNHFWGLQAFVI